MSTRALLLQTNFQRKKRVCKNRKNKASTCVVEFSFRCCMVNSCQSTVCSLFLFKAVEEIFGEFGEIKEVSRTPKYVAFHLFIELFILFSLLFRFTVCRNYKSSKFKSCIVVLVTCIYFYKSFNLKLVQISKRLFLFQLLLHPVSVQTASRDRGIGSAREIWCEGSTGKGKPETIDKSKGHSEQTKLYQANGN